MKRFLKFTIIELIVVIIFASLAATIALYQWSNIEASQLDEDRKTAINAMYYNLEEVFYVKNGHYPSQIDRETLTAMDSELFIDPEGKQLGESGSDYRYDAVDCENDRCKGYILTGSLVKEADYIKRSRNN